jgi:hypothetical protein
MGEETAKVAEGLAAENTGGIDVNRAGGDDKEKC